MTLTVTEATVADHYDGIIIRFTDWEGDHACPGWQCRACGWKIGTSRLPPPRQCPEDGERQERERRERDANEA